MPTQEKDMPRQEEATPGRAKDELGEVTRLLVRWRIGDEDALNQLIPIVDGELRRRAHQYLRRERPGHMMQTTALVDDVWMRLARAGQVDWQDRAHFYAVAAEAMRRILVDEARKHDSQKRGGRWTRALFEEQMVTTVELDLDLLALDEALEWLKQRSARKHRVVVLRFYGGLTIRETAVVLDVSADTVKNDWETAKLWLFRKLSGEEASDGSRAI
ncbi:MAG: ECF-type sigma factor [Acidobacteria bacterium]|nr:ECF-type sigma factor [Acidobacteriota bacterium]